MLTKIEKEIVSGIDGNLDINKIMKTSGISKDELITILKELKTKNYKYLGFSNFSGKLNLKEENTDNLNSQSIIYIPGKRNKIRFTIVSDTHFGRVDDDLSYTDCTYDYNAKNNINTTFHLGDGIDGVAPQRLKHLKYKTFSEQAEYFIKNYPQDDGIITYILMGNHDLFKNFSFTDVLRNERLDIIPLTKERCFIRNGMDEIALAHRIESLKTLKREVKLGFCGHTHSFAINSSRNSNIITAPTLSNVFFDGGAIDPGFLDVSITPNKHGLGTVLVKEKIIRNKNIYTAGEATYTLKS